MHTLFEVRVEPWGSKYEATCEDFPLIFAYGETPEVALANLRRVIHEIHPRRS
jgi:predicted RNase H-like HicB family nuclease